MGCMPAWLPCGPDHVEEVLIALRRLGPGGERHPTPTTTIRSGNAFWRAVLRLGTTFHAASRLHLLLPSIFTSD